MRNQKRPGDEIGDENIRACDRYPSRVLWKLHARERGHYSRNDQDREPNSERYSAFCWPSGQVRENDAILVGRLGQRSLDRMLPIPPCRSTLRADREVRILARAPVDPESLGGRPAAGFVRARQMDQHSIFGQRIYPGRRTGAPLTGVSRGMPLFSAARRG